ncbi:MAG: hypothetical protein IJ540_11775 [Prevotella sp.]|nr:hypothetical protein [Prevotella sp.]
MKKILLIMLALLTIGSQMEVSAKKEKKGIKWEWDGTKSGNATIDNYLLQIDTLYRKVQSYQESIDTYAMKDTTLNINGKYYQLAWMEDSNKNILTRATVNWQCVQAYTLGASIILNMASAGLGSATAATALPQLGFKALKFAKYVKGGPAVISQGTKAIKAVRGKWIANSRKWKAMKDGAIADPKTIGFDGFTPEIINKFNKCFYIKEIKEDSPEYEEVVKHFTGKTPEEIAEENKNFANEIALSTVLPEDKSKALDEAPDLEEELDS